MANMALIENFLNCKKFRYNKSWNSYWKAKTAHICTHDHYKLKMWGDQAEWVLCQEYWFWDTSIIVWNSLIVSYFFQLHKIVYILEPYVRFW